MEELWPKDLLRRGTQAVCLLRGIAGLQKPSFEGPLGGRHVLDLAWEQSSRLTNTVVAGGGPNGLGQILQSFTALEP